MLASVIGTLNWLALGSPLKCPPSAKAGAPLSDAQHAMCMNLERHIRYFMSAGPFEGQLLGRCEEKFSHLLRALKELPCIAPAITDVDLAELVCSMQHEIDPYGRSEPEGILPQTSDSPDLPAFSQVPEETLVPEPPACTPAASGSNDRLQRPTKPASGDHEAKPGQDCQFPVGIPPLLGPLGISNRNIVGAPLKRPFGPEVAAESSGLKLPGHAELLRPSSLLN